MRTFSEQQIASLAPNANAVSNGRKLSAGGKFVSLMRSEDDSFYMGECKGSGKSNYVVSADFADEDHPVFRCSCPSRQFPCKHSLGLMKQLTDQLMNTGLSSMGSVSLKNYRDLAKQLGDYYLPGPQNHWNQLVLEMEAYQKDADKEHYHRAVEVLKRLRALEKKATDYLNEKLDTDQPEADDDILYEKLGGIWKLEQLGELGLLKEQARLVQLSFQVDYDAARKEYIDLGYWADVDTGEISCTCNYRPVKALKYVKQEDSCFDMARIGRLYYYPGGMNRRVRWDAASLEPVTLQVLKSVRAHAHKDVGSAVKLAKNEMKNLLSEDTCGMLLAFSRIGITETGEGKCWVLEDAAGGRIELAGRPGQEDGMAALARIPVPEVFQDQALFGLMYYDREKRRIRMCPCSIVTDQGIIRLLY